MLSFMVGFLTFASTYCRKHFSWHALLSHALTWQVLTFCEYLLFEVLLTCGRLILYTGSIFIGLLGDRGLLYCLMVDVDFHQVGTDRQTGTGMSLSA